MAAGETELLFALEGFDEAPGGKREAGTDVDDLLLMGAHLSYLMKPLSAQAAELARAVELCTVRHNLRTGSQPSTRELGAALATRGFAPRMHASAGGGSGTAAFRNLRHTFLTVRLPVAGAQALPQQLALPGMEEEGEAEAAAARGLDLLIDPHFACQFLVASPTPRYATLQHLLPQTFVGSLEQLEHVVEWVCREMEWSFRQQHVPLPPWREQSAMRTKWWPRPAAPPSPPAGSSPSGSPPAACCATCWGAGAANSAVAAVAAAGAAGCCTGHRSPASVVSAALEQATALTACSSGASSAPSAHFHAAASMQLQAGRRASLLSRSLEVAGLRRASSSGAPARHTLPQPHWAGGEGWHTPRVVVVRRST